MQSFFLSLFSAAEALTSVLYIVERGTRIESTLYWFLSPVKTSVNNFCVVR
jgi:hypothetical protein